MHDFDLSNSNPAHLFLLHLPIKFFSVIGRRLRQQTKYFLTWEPYVSQLLVNDQLHVVIDSSRFTGYNR